MVAATTHLGNMYSGPMMAPRTQQELVAACAIHGRSPFNDATVRAARRRPADVRARRMLQGIADRPAAGSLTGRYPPLDLAPESPADTASS